MLNDLSPFLDEQKRSDVVNRLENKKVEQSLPAEMELALTWLLKDFDELEIEPDWWPSKKPDAYAKGLLKEKPTAIEIKTVADNSISGEPEMDHCSSKLMEIANKSKRGSGDFLYFHFAESTSRERGKSVRNIAAPKDYTASEETIARVSSWISSSPPKAAKLRVDDQGLLCTIEWRDFKRTRFHNFRTSRPPRTYSDTKNPIYAQLKLGLQKFKEAPHGCSRIIFLADGGSKTLSDLTERNHLTNFEQHSTATSIINKFITDTEGRIDAVIVFVPLKQFRSGFLQQRGYDRKWAVIVFGVDNTLNQELFQKMAQLVDKLPKPRFNAMQARSLTRQNAMNHDPRGWYLGTKIEWRDGEMTYKISSRAFHEFLAGKIDEKRFRYILGERDDETILKKHLEMGYTIKTTRFERGGIDEDDDYIVLEFDQFNPDAAASKFK